MSSEVELEIQKRLAVLTIDRPDRRNAIGLGTMDELEGAFDAAERAAVNVLVIRGAGTRAFVSGGDLKELAAIRDEQGAVEMALRMRRLLDRLARLPFPTISALNGDALGGGAEVAVAADLRVASQEIRIGFTQVRLAIMPAWGGAERLVELVGRSRALLLIGSGDTLTAPEAERIGLVDVLATRTEFDGAWLRIAESFATLPPEAARSIKHVITAAKPNDHPALESEAVRRFAQLWIADEHWQAAER